MDLKEARDVLSKEEWADLAHLSGTSPQYLNQIALKFRRPSVGLAERIEKALQELKPSITVTKEELVFSPLRVANSSSGV